MRTRDKILDACGQAILAESNIDIARAWIEVRKIEVLIDIRDILEIRIPELISSIYNTLGKD